MENEHPPHRITVDDLETHVGPRGRREILQHLRDLGVGLQVVLVEPSVVKIPADPPSFGTPQALRELDGSQIAVGDSESEVTVGPQWAATGGYMHMLARAPCLCGFKVDPIQGHPTDVWRWSIIGVAGVGINLGGGPRALVVDLARTCRHCGARVVLKLEAPGSKALSEMLYQDVRQAGGLPAYPSTLTEKVPAAGEALHSDDRPTGKLPVDDDEEVAQELRRLRADEWRQAADFVQHQCSKQGTTPAAIALALRERALTIAGVTPAATVGGAVTALGDGSGIRERLTKAVTDVVVGTLADAVAAKPEKWGEPARGELRHLVHDVVKCWPAEWLTPRQVAARIATNRVESVARSLRQLAHDGYLVSKLIGVEGESRHRRGWSTVEHAERTGVIPKRKRTAARR